MTAYNRKINTDGTYRLFHGYTVVSMIKNDLKCIEEYIKNNKLLSSYFSPLPSSSYHMTVFNIWCHSQDLLPIQKNWLIKMKAKYLNIEKDIERLKKEYPERPTPYFEPYSIFKKKYLEEVSSKDSKYYINKDLFTELMYNVDKVCVNQEFIGKGIAGSSFYGLGISLLLDENSNQQWENQRSLIAPLVGHNDSNLSPHVTLGYRYKDIPVESQDAVQCELNKLNEFVQSKIKNGLIFLEPRATWFHSMCKYMNSDEFYY
jgi:hypothetical protein